jgi:HK97 family phage major capsid protein
MSVSLVPKGRTFVRSLIARSFRLDENAIADRWGAYEAPAITKAAVAALDTTETGDPSGVEFLQLVREASLLGRLPSLRNVPFMVRMTRMTSGSRAYWVGQAAPKPLSRPALDGSQLDPLKVVCIVVATKESLGPSPFGTGLTEANLQTDMQRAVALALDEAFIDSANAGVSGEMPASVTNGATLIASTGDPASDLARMVAAFAGNLETAAFVTDPTTATQLALKRDSAGAFLFPDVGPRGGTLLGLPLLTTRASTWSSGGGQITLIDASGIAAGIDGIRVDKSDAASLLMSDDPENDPGTLVSLFQTNSVAFKVEVYANWEAQRTGGVVVLTGVDYGAE